MKRFLSLLLGTILALSCVIPVSLTAQADEPTVPGGSAPAGGFENAVVSIGKPVTIGANNVSAPKVTDGITNTNNNYTDSTQYGLVTPRAQVSSSTCYVEIDLQREYPLSAINTVTYSKSGRVYKWDAYVARDNTKPISDWTLVGGKTSDEVSTYAGYTIDFQPVKARYVRIYGTANSDNTAFHWLEVLVYAKLNKVSFEASAVSGTGASAAVVTDGAVSNSGCVDIPWGATAGDATSAYGVSGSCYVQLDLGEIFNVTDINVANYTSTSRHYQWEAYGSNDPDAPISSWTLLGEKKNTLVSTANGYTVSVNKTPARYIRVYGTYNSANTGYHFSEVAVYTGGAVKTNVSYGKSARLSSGQTTGELTDGVLTASVDLGAWGAVAGDESSSFGNAGSCFAEIDLTTSTEIFSVGVQNPDKNYKWAVYASNDNTANISAWTYLGGKTEIGNEAFTEIGFPAASFRYVRIYGLYNATNLGFHINEVYICSDAEATVPKITFSSVGSGFVNMTGENVTNGFATVLPLSVTGGAQTPALFKAGVQNGDYAVRLVFTDAYGAPYEIAAQPKFYEGDVWYFEPVFAGFAPVKGQIYSVRMDLYDTQGELAFSGSTGSVLCPVHPVVVYDGTYTPVNEILPWYNDTPVASVDGAPVLEPSGLNEKYFLASDASDGFDLSYELRLYVNGVEYTQFEITNVVGSSYLDRCAMIDLASCGFAPSSEIASDVVIEAYVSSYPSGAKTLEARYYLPSFTASAEVVGSVGRAYSIYGSQGKVTVSYTGQSYTLTAVGGEPADFAFKGWYVDGALESTDTTYTFVPSAGDDLLIVGMYGPAAEAPLQEINIPSDLGPFVTEGSNPSLTYAFDNDLAGSAAGTISFTAVSSGTYKLYWLDSMNNKLSATMNGKTIPYSALAELTLGAGQTGTYKPIKYAAIPYGAAKLAVYKGTAQVIALSLPAAKTLTGTYDYAYGLMSDLHYNSFPKYVEGGGDTDYAIDAVNNAYTFFREAGVTTVFQTGDYSTYADEVSYQRYAAGVASSGLLVLAAGGNHEVNGNFNNMFGQNGLWFRYVNLGVYNGQVDGVTEIAPNGFDFVYRKPGTNDIFVFVCQEKWDGRKATQGYLISMDTMNWLEGVLEQYKNNTVHLMLHTFIVDDDGEDVDGEGDFTNSAGYGYHYHYNVYTEDYAKLRELLGKYRNVIWFNGHSHWTYSMQEINENLNILDYDGTFATCVHIPSVTAPRTVSDTGTAYSSNANVKSEGTLMFRANGYEIVNGVDFKTGELLAYGCYIIYDEGASGTKYEGAFGESGVSWTFNAQTSALTISGQGAMPDFENPADAPYAQFAAEIQKVYVSRGVTSIGKNAFAGFTALATAEIKDTVISVGENAFAGCPIAEKLTLTDSVKTIGNNAFADLSANTPIVFDGAPERFAEISVGVGNTALTTGSVTCLKRVITFVFGDIRDTRDFRLGVLPYYDGVIYKQHEDPEQSYSFAGWTDGLICFPTDLPAVTENATYFALFNEMDGGTVGGSEKYVSWTLDKATGVLTITGYGPMRDYADYTDTPWYQYSPYIKTIEVKKGVLSIGANAFRNLTSVTTVILETKLIRIGGCAMMGMSALKDLYLPSTLMFGAKRMTYQSGVTAIYYDGTREAYEPVGNILRLWGNTDDFAPDGGKMVYNTSVTHEEAFTVVFKDTDGTVLATHENVNWGGCVLPPEMSDRDGLYFLGWNGNYRYITSDTVLTAVYSEEPDPDINVEIEPKPLTVKPYYGKIENYSGATYFITGLAADDNDALFAYLKSGAMLLKFTLKDEATGRSYVIDPYHFDKPGTEFYGTSFLRINVCPYGVTPDPTHAYTVTVEVYSGKNTIYRGTSAEGAFLSTDSAFTENGAIVPSTIPYTHTVICTTHVRADGGDCETDGVCVYCGAILPAGAHTIVIDPRVAPTATKTGLTEGSHCAVCGKIIVAQKIIPATGVTGSNVALYKKVTGVGAGKVSITDGDTSVTNFWDGGLYPSAAIIDLIGYYDLSNINVVTYHGDGRYYYFNVYVSTDGRTWTLAGSKNDNTVADENGTDFDVQVTARYVKVEITKNSRNTSAHLVEVSAYGVLCPDFVPPTPVLVDPNDPENIAFGKPTRTNSVDSISDYVNDGSTTTIWSAYYFPNYVDIDLLENYDLSEIKVFMPADGYTYAYTVYGSTDGISFTQLAKTDALVSSPENGRSFTFGSGTVYRVIRVNVTACGGGTYKPAKIAEIKAYGTPDASAVTATRDVMAFTTYDEWLLSVAGVDLSQIKDANGKYDIRDTYTEADTVAELNGIVTRLLGAQYISWFTFDVSENPTSSGKDFFRIEDENGKVKISGSDGVCIAAGLNWYLKYFCKVHISQETAQTTMPAQIVPVGTPVFKETAQKVRYAYNYCTLSYTMAFFGYDDWRRELDWLYLNGVNLILDITGIEALWVSYLQKLGYTADDAKAYACGPGYKAWWMMGNLENFNGTVSDLYVSDMLEMARVNQRSMTVMGASPALQAFVGAMPDSFGFYADEALTALGYDHPAPNLVAQGLWQGFDRPNVLRTDYNGYSYLAQLFYETQNELFGQITDYYCGDVCHEGGKIPSGLTKADMTAVILDELMASDETGVWMLQRWQSNPTRDELDGMNDYRTTNVIVIDLASARDTSKWKNTTTYGGKEFGGTNWIFSSLDNFGGRPLMHGALQTVVNNIADAKQNAVYMVGMGMTPEGTQNNPVYYDLYWEMLWRDEAPDVSVWINDYLERRYGGTSENLQNAWAQLLASVYAYPNTNGTSGNFMVIGNKPRLDNFVGGYFEVKYSNRTLLTALTYMMSEFDTYADNECYVYDLVEMMQTYLANKAQNYISTIITMAGTPTAYDAEEFNYLIDSFLAVIALENEISSYSENQLVGKWIGRADEWTNDARTGAYDDYMVDTMKTNARMLISSWTSTGVLIDYANRLYNGLVEDYYYKAWSTFLDDVRTRFAAGLSSSTQVYASASYLHDALEFVLNGKEYQSVVSAPRGDADARGIEAIFAEILENHAPESFEPTYNDTDIYAQFGGISKKFTSVEFYSDTNQFECWPVNDNGTWCARASFHTLIRVNDSGLNYLATNLGTPNYPYTWKFYYQESDTADVTEWSGPYTGYVETKSNASFLRHQVSNCPEGDLCANFEVGKTYNLLFDVYNGSTHVGFGVLPFTWTQKYAANHDLYTDFWLNHDRSEGYTSGKQTVTARDTAVATALGFNTSGGYVGSSHVHNFGEWTQVSVENGVVTEQHNCSSCGFTEQRTRSADHEHIPVVDPAVAPTCTMSGLTEGSHCSVCGEVLTAQTVIPATGHTWNEGVVTKQPTRTETGIMTYTCTVCGATRTEVIPMITTPPGDVTGNGYVNINDVTTLLNYLSANGAFNATYEVLEDGVIDVSDVTALLDILASPH